MTINPTSYRTSPYLGTPYWAPQNVLNRSQMSPRTVPLSFNWLTYFTAYPSTNLSVPIDLTGGNVQGGLLDYIKGVKIDNTNSQISMAVYFPDTGDIITCPPQSVVTAPVMTNGLKCFVVALGLSAGNVPTTKVYLTNLVLPFSTLAQVNQTVPFYKGSPTVQLNQSQILTPGYAPPALGDQAGVYTVNMNANNQVVMFGGARASGYIYLTALDVAFVNGNSGVAIVSATKIYSTGTAGELTRFWMGFQAAGSFNYVKNTTLAGIQWRLDATQNWFFAHDPADSSPFGNWSGGLCVLNLAYTYSTE